MKAALPKVAHKSGNKERSMLSGCSCKQIQSASPAVRTTLVVWGLLRLFLWIIPVMKRLNPGMCVPPGILGTLGIRGFLASTDLVTSAYDLGQAAEVWTALGQRCLMGGQENLQCCPLSCMDLSWSKTGYPLSNFLSTRGRGIGLDHWNHVQFLMIG